jgi:vitamin B12 transporter
LHFTDKPGNDTAAYSLDSHIRSSKMMTDASFRWFVRKHWRFELSGSFTSSTAIADAYQNKIKEVQAALMAGVKYNHKRRLIINLTARQHFYLYKVLPQISLGTRYIIIPQHITLRSRIYTHYKIPDFNDRYWIPGGNRNLRPETGWGITTGVDEKHPLGKRGNLLLSIDVYYNVLRDQIMWIPGSGSGFWSPVNLQQSKMTGMEQTGKIRFQTGKILFSFGESYYLTHSVIVKNDFFPEYISNTNPYIPRHSATANAGIEIGKFYGSLFESFTGSRYTTPDNQTWYRLDPYAITSIATGIKTQLNRWEFSVQGLIHNLFNKSYQSVSARPLPGRAFSLQIKCTFLNIQKPSQAY